MLADLPQRLRGLGFYILPIAGTLKSPSVFSKEDGKPYRIAHKKYREKPPTEWLINRWFYPNHPYGYFLHGGQLDVCCIDFDQKNYESQDAVDKEYQTFVTKLEGYIVWTEQSLHGGYHVWVKLTNKPEFTNFATDNVIRKHRGEVIVNGGVAIFPTVGYKLLIDNLDQFNNIPAVDNLEPYGIYPTSKSFVTKDKDKVTKDKVTKVIEMSDLISRQNYKPDALLSLTKLVNKTTQDLLDNLVTDTVDRSDVFTKATKELVGWCNKLTQYDFAHNDRLEDLINRLVTNLGIEDKADRSIKSLKNIEQLEPSKLKYITEEELMSQLQAKQKNEATKQIVTRLINKRKTITNVLDKMQLDQEIIKLGSNLLGIKSVKDIEELSLKLNTVSGGFKTKSYVELSEDIPEEINWQIEGLLPVGKVIFLASQAKVGKSTLVTDLAKATVNGSKLLDKFQCRPTDVLWCNGDESDTDTVSRLKQINYKDVGDRRIHFSREFSFDNLDSLTTYIKQNPQIGLIVIDSFSRYTVGKDTTKPVEAYPQLVWFVDWCEKHKITSVILNHETKPNDNKKGANKMAGCSDLQRPVEGIYRLEKSGKRLKLICDGGRNLPENEWQIERNSDPSEMGCFFSMTDVVTVEPPPNKVLVGDQIVECLKRHFMVNPDSTFTSEDIANELALTKTTVGKNLSEGLSNIEMAGKQGKCHTYRYTIAVPVTP
jgi:hypothetical protein